VTLPLYASGPASAGWWAMGITMLAIFTAFVCLVFGYFFYWTLHQDFIPAGAADQTMWAWLGLAATVVAWVSTGLARKWNAEDRATAFYGASACGVIAAIAAAAALLSHPYLAGLNPAAHVYPSIIWLLAIWSALHLAIGIVMLLYCAARRFAGRMTARYDMEIANVVLYWHFTMVTVAITVALNAGVPRVV
jgi:cytochrome c oxidase subunit I+III